MKCPKCRSVGEIHVEVGMKIPSDMYMQISKTNIRRKGCKMLYAGWPKALFVCKACNYSEKGL